MNKSYMLAAFFAGLVVALLVMFSAAALAGVLMAELRPAAGLLVSLTIFGAALLIVSFYIWLYSPSPDNRKDKSK